MKYIAIKNFKKFQHYKKRNPPWIKLHAELLTNWEFFQLSEPAQRHVMFLWVLASKHHNRIPLDLPYITSTIHAKSAVDVDELVRTGWIELREDARQRPETGKARKPVKRKKIASVVDASAPQADDKHGASALHKSTEVESETEKEPPSVSRGGWVGVCGDIYAKARGGIAPYGEIGNHLKPLVDLKGEAEVVARFTIFCASPKVQYGIYYFAKNYGDFETPVINIADGKLSSRAAFLKSQGY